MIDQPDTLLAEFAQSGFVRLPGALGAPAARGMCDRIWEHLGRAHGIRRDDPATWTVARPAGFQALSRADAFAPLACPAVTRAAERILGTNGRATLAPSGAVPLVTFPAEPGSHWGVPCRHWHLDFSARAPVRPLPAVRVLAFLAPVGPRGGGTLIASGTHRLVEGLVETGRAGAGRSADLRTLLAREHPWFGALTEKGRTSDGVERFMGSGETSAEVALRVAELCGEPGDVVLMHPWAFHAFSSNCGKAPRIMLSHSYLRA